MMCSDYEEPSILILPNLINTLWSKTESILKKMASGPLGNLFDFLEILSILISLHYPNEKSPYNLKILLKVFETFDETEIKYFLRVFLPKLAQAALHIQILFPTSVKLMKQNKEISIQLSKKQLFCLISHMFLCTFHEQKNSKLSKYRNFIYLYNEEENSRISLKKNKILAFYNYLKRNINNVHEAGTIIYQRILLDPKTQKPSRTTKDSWLKSTTTLVPISFHEQKLIEDSKNSMQIIFCNKRLGGGVLENGGLQEELSFIRNPEMLPALLIAEELEDYEVFYYHGCESFNLISGYGEKMIFEGDILDKFPLDIYDKKDCCFVAIDAIPFQEKSHQYNLNMILRELNKAFLGFYGSDLINDNPKKEIATGKWGCGDFKGDFELKFIIQWLAASECKRDLHFYFPGKENLEPFYSLIKKFKELTVGEVFGYLMEFSKMATEQNIKIGVFEFIKDFVD